MITVRRYQPSDWAAIWDLIEPVFRAGETYTFPRDINEADAKRLWIDIVQATYVCVDDMDTVLGTYYIKPNQMGPGNHVCNCGYIVGEQARGKGIARLMNEHSQKEAIRLDYRAMQYNAVVSTNKVAVRLWKSLGFEHVGTLPGAFYHPKHRYVDALILFKTLVS